jgi:3-oxoacyl-[acyl-carrier-protein] synthase II
MLRLITTFLAQLSGRTMPSRTLSEFKHPIAVTGLGAVTGFGWGAAALEAGLASGRTAIAPLTRFDASAYPTRIAAEVPPAPAALRRLRGWGGWSLADRFAVAAAQEASTAAGLPFDETTGRGAGVFFGGSTGGLYECEQLYESHRRGRLARAPRGPIRRHLVQRPAEAVARLLGADGPVETVCSACASGTLAIGAAIDALRRGDVKVAFAGGSDSLARVTYGGFNALRAVDAAPCRPFRADRAGMSLGEGAGVLVLERLDEAHRRGAAILAECAGAGASADAHHMTAPRPDGEGAARAIARALHEAGRPASDVALINTHGTGTPLNDRAEFAALVRALGAVASEVPLAVTKGSVGHVLGGAGAVEAVATVLAIARQRLQPVPGGGTIDPDTPVRLTREARAERIGAALSINLGFGGVNAALCVARAAEKA